MKNTIVSLAIGMGAMVALQCGATSLDLTAAGNNGSINGAFFQQVPDQSTGTGVIDPFVRIQKNGTEEGYNTSFAPMPDVKTGTWTHDVLLGEIPIVTLGATRYYQFLLDINEDSGGPASNPHELLSLHEIEIYTRAGALNPADTYAALSGATLRWDLDAGVTDGDSVIELNYALNSGSGSGDMFMYVPENTLGTDLSLNLYLYSAFGTAHSSSDGFEEWAVLVGENGGSVPDGGVTAGLLGLALLGLGAIRRKLA